MDILAITSMRNEGPHCLEWIAHHLAAGVDHFLIYSNNCNDGTDTILDLLATAGIVTHEQLPPSGRSVQWQALKHATNHELYSRADWVLTADCDEFINLRAPLATLPDLISALPADTDALAMPWRLFGSSNHHDMQSGLTIERFIRAAPVDISLPLAHFFKTLFRPAAFRQAGVHRPKRKKDAQPVWVDASGRYMPAGFATQDARINLFGLPVASELVQLNHYSLRAAANFMVKRARGLPNHIEREIGLGYWVERNFNTVEDSTILGMLPATTKKLDELLKIPGMAKLHASAFSAHETIFATMMAKRKEVQLFWQLALSSSSTPPPPGAARAHTERLAKAGNSGG